MFNWDQEGDRCSFEDSDQFEEDSLCSWISEPESLCNNWRGWKRTTNNGGGGGERVVSGIHHPKSNKEEGQVLSLVELAAREVACHIPFEVVEHVYPPVPEQLQLRIACWSFPENEEDIRLYSCLANGSADEFLRGEHLYKAKAVKDPLQIGFHLSATLVPTPTMPQTKGSYNVAVTFDRRRITSCNCTCSSTASWCAHVVAVCLHRIHLPGQVCLRAPVSESLSRLHRDQLQKFAQYLISELPQQILPTAQRLLDELLSCQQTAINTVCGAPDPTAGASASEQTTWCLDELTLHDNIHKILIKFCVPSPIVFSDVNYLSSTAPPAAAEWTSLLRPLRGREPEGMWNLLSIVREMYRRNDRNAMLLLEILTEECLSCEQILMWWFNTKVSLHNGNLGHGGRGGMNSNTHASQHACSSLCDEIVVLWRLAGLNPALSPEERRLLSGKLREWHLKAVDKICRARGAGNAAVGGANCTRRSDIEIFTGFKGAIEACLMDWDDYPIPGVTYARGAASRYYLPYCAGSRLQDGHGGAREVSSSAAVLNCEHPAPPPCVAATLGPIGGTAGCGKSSRTVGISVHHHHHHHSERGGRAPPSSPRHSRASGAAVPPAGAGTSQAHDGNRSSVSSEGFCENETEGPGGSQDSDSVEEQLALTAGTSATLPPSNFGLATLLSNSMERREETRPASSTADDVASQVAAAVAAVMTELTVSTPSNKGSKSSPDEQDSDWSSAPESGGAEKAVAVGGAEFAGHRPELVAVASTSSLSVPVASVKLEPQQSESQPSSDEFQVYYYDPKAKVGPQERSAKERKAEEGPCNVFASIRRIEDPMEILFAQAEALHAHGHTREACQLGVKLAEELLSNPPDLMVELPPPPTKGKRKKKVNPASHQISCLAGATLSKTAFLCTVLSENTQNYHLAFRVGMYGLEMARPPASTKALEVKLANQETELVNLLKRIPLGSPELTVIREKAEQLRDGKLTSRGDALLPLNLTSFIVDALCFPTVSALRIVFNSGLRLQSDEYTGFEAAVAALGLKANVSEADHPLLCEGTRRQRGDLALSLLVHYKDDQDKLAKIMEKLLDKEIHQMYKAPTLSCYYSNKPNQAGHIGSGGAKGGATSQPVLKREGTSESDDIGKPGTFSSSNNLASPGLDEGSVPDLEKDAAQLGLGGNGALRGMPGTSGARAKDSVGYKNRCADDKRDDTSSPTWVEDYKVWEAKFRCTNFRTQKKRSAGMASIDSSAPETTSSDNSPTLVRRSVWNKPVGPGSDSGSSGGKSSDSFGSSSSGDKAGRPKVRENESPPPNFPFIRCQNLFGTETVVRTVTTCPKNTRFKGKRSYPSIPNQPSEASAHFMFELAKTVLTKAGGNSSTSLFTQPTANQNHRGPHRALHMCAFQIGLYALGLHNCVSPNWLSRTYSSHVSWITSQALEIGSAAISFLIDTWEGHLTPPEVASLADRASRGRDPNVVGTAAELALSCLPHAHALNPNEIQRAISQCKEQTNAMLERACLAVEGAAKGGGVYPEVLFDVAHRWHELYNESMPTAASADPSFCGGANVLSAPTDVAGLPLLPSASSAAAAAGVPLDSIPLSLDALMAPTGIAPAGVGEANLLGGSPPDVPAAPPSRLQQLVGQLSQQQQQPPPSPSLSLMNQVAVTVSHGLPYSVPPPLTSSGVPFGPGPLPYSYLSNFPPHHQGVYSHHHHHPMPLPHHGLHPYVAAPFSYANASGFPMPTQAYYSMPAVTVASQMRTPPPSGLYTPLQLASMQCAQQQQPRPGLIPSQNGAQASVHVMSMQPGLAHHQQQQQQISGHQQPRNPAPAAINPTQVNYLLSTYRVGMLALETLARRVHDDRPNAKYARNPPYGEDVKWLLGVAKKLGTTYVQQFCLCTVNSVASPFLLQEIAWDAAHYLSRNNAAAVVQHLRSPVLTPLVQKCQQMFIQCTHLKMYHLTSAEYEEFVGIIRSARTAFQMTPGGIMQFSEFLQALRRSKTCKKDLWQKIASAIQCGSV